MVTSAQGSPAVAHTPERYPYIDLLRGFAALLVVACHVLAFREWPNFVPTGFGKLAQMGWVGVDLFLVISGFVIGKTAMAASGTGRPWRGHFVERRLRRIVPLYLATLVLYLLLVDPAPLLNGWRSVIDVAMHVGFIHNLYPGTHGTINSPNWSLGLEMQFYLLVAILAPWLAASKVWKVLAVWLGIAVLWKYALTLVLIPGASVTHHQFIYASQLPGTLDEFAFGICIAKLVGRNALRFSWQRFLAWSAAAVVLLAGAWITIGHGGDFWQSTAMIVFWRTTLAAGFAAVLAVSIMVPGSGGWVLRPFRYLGEISYGIYLWHLPVLLTLIDKTSFKGWQLMFATVGCTVVLAAFSWHGFEKLWMRRDNS
jgi:peptidoglycan/LPS O-acetylase OafA/YrhL